MFKNIQAKHKALLSIFVSAGFFLFLFQNMMPLRTPLLLDLNYTDGVFAKDPTNYKDYLEDEQGNPLYGFINGEKCMLYKMVAGNQHYPLFFNNVTHSRGHAWSLGQWDSEPVDPLTLTRVDPNVSEWINPYKKFSIGKPGSGKKGIIMGINGEMEYNGLWVPPRETICEERLHPAMLIAQMPVALTFSNYKKLMFQFKMKVLKDELKPQYLSGWDKKSTTSHIKIHVNIRNIRADKNVALGHGQTFGLSINFYDVRNTDTSYASGDFIHRPQKRYMLKLGPDDLLPGTRTKLHQKMWVNLENIDLMPFIKKAFENAIKFGDRTDGYVDKIIERDLGKYMVSSINYGWELSSLHNVEAHISDINLEAEH